VLRDFAHIRLNVRSTSAEGVEYSQIAQAPTKITSGIFINQIMMQSMGLASSKDDSTSIVDTRQYRNFAPSIRLLGLNEFYQKGCQEKTSASTGVEVLFLDTQPTFHRLRCRDFAFEFS